MAVVVLVVGRPASGKSTVAAAIGRRFGLPVLAKDDVKELLLDSLGVGDREWSRRLGRAAFDLLDHAIDLLVSAGASFVVDANFAPEVAGPRLEQLRSKHGFEVVQVHCTAPEGVLLDRFARRAASDRHPGHLDADHVDEFAATLRDGRAETLDIPGPLLEARANDTGRLALEPLLERLAPLVRPGGPEHGKRRSSRRQEEPG